MAVAYIGIGWSQFLDPSNLSTVVVSPDLGSNPAAIVELADTLGWENVLLLERLHSKLYIGKNAVMLGSANLSNNAFGVSGQEEVCVILPGEEQIRKAQELFDKYATKAKAQFPDKQSKLARIEKLRQARGKAMAHGLLEIENLKVLNFGGYNQDRDGHVHFAWYQNYKFEYTDEIPFAIQNDIANEMHLSPDMVDTRNRLIS